jgi:hypothetical protein
MHIHLFIRAAANSGIETSHTAHSPFTPIRYIGRSSAYFAENIIFTDRPVRHRLSEFNRVCVYCGALHWDEEALVQSRSTGSSDGLVSSILNNDAHSSSILFGHTNDVEETTVNNVALGARPGNTISTVGQSRRNFGSCCLQGAVVLPMFDKPPPLLWKLYTENTEGLLHSPLLCFFRTIADPYVRGETFS